MTLPENTDADAGWDDEDLIDYMADQPQEQQATPPADAGVETAEVPPLGEGDTDPSDPEEA